MTITPERLAEIEAAPREACLFKAEAKELADAYRERDALLRKLHTMLEAKPAEPVAWVDPATLARLTPETAVMATLAGKSVYRLTAPLYAAPPARAAVPPGWSIQRKDKRPFKRIEIIAPNGYSAIAYSTASNPENILYMLADTLIAAGDKP